MSRIKLVIKTGTYSFQTMKTRLFQLTVVSTGIYYLQAVAGAVTF
jgi:hypothetical protein